MSMLNSRMCSLKQLEPSRAHNQFLNGGNTYSTKDTSILAWGVCYLFSKQKITNGILDLGATKSKKMFERVMNSIAKKNIWCSCGPVRMSFTKEYEDEEFLRLHKMRKAFWDYSLESPKPVAVFPWKLIDITEIWGTKQPNFLKNIQCFVDCCHKNLSKLKESV